MQTTSQLWDDLAAGGSLMETRVTINGTTYSPVGAPEIARQLMGSDLSVGNCNSASCTFVLQTTDIIPKSAQVLVEMRFYDEDESSEWLPAGTFYISKRQRDPISGRIALTCYDAMLKGNAPFEYGVLWGDDQGNQIVTNEGKSIIFKPPYLSMVSTVNSIAMQLGVEVDSRTVINTGEDWRITPQAEGQSICDVLAGIAIAHGGNWCITPENKLRLVPLIDAAGAASAETYVSVSAVTGDCGVSDQHTITGLLVTENGVETLYGADTGIVVVINGPYTNNTIRTALQTALIGQKFQPYTMTTAKYNPAAELGDYIKYSDLMAGVLYNENAVLDASYHADITTPDPGEVTDEYPYIGNATKALNEAKAYVQEVVGELNETLDQEEVFNRLTNGGQDQGIYLENGKIYINAEYIVTGIIASKNKKSWWNLINGRFFMNGGEIDIRAGNGMGFAVGEYGDIAVGQKPENLSDFDNNYCGFQVNNSGQMKVKRIYLYGPESDETFNVCVGAIDAAASQGGISINSADGNRKLFLSNNGVKVSYGLGISGGIVINPDNNPKYGVNATFMSQDGKTVTVSDGIITSIA